MVGYFAAHKSAQILFICAKMCKYYSVLVLWTAIICLEFGISPAYNVDNNPYKHIEILDKDGKYQLEWLVEWDKSRVIFNVTVQTKGYVGLGLSKKGKMAGADIVIGGVMPNGEPYFSDRHAIGNDLPVEDPSQDWDLHKAWENASHTFLSFSRPFETCDEDHDLPIHGDTITLLWAFGEKDNEIEYHFQNRGVFLIHLLDPDLAPRELKATDKTGISSGGTSGDNTLGNWKVWSISQQYSVPDKDTTYICTIHKSPPTRKAHIVGIRAVLPTDVDVRHVHHFVFSRCMPPDEETLRMFENAVGQQEECYIHDQTAGSMPIQHCTDYTHVWAVGQRPAFYPEHVGIPMLPNSYYMLQVHYDNPELIPGIQANSTLEVFYTENLRKHDAALLVLGQQGFDAGASIMVPPNSLAHEIYGHCAPECTKRSLPPDGIRVFAVYHHTHLAGRQVRLMHIRNGKELPWISYDDNFSFNLQNSRTLREERVILPGDALYNRCVYENTDRQGNVTIGGFSTSSEMAVTIMWYYNKIPDRSLCYSEIRSPIYKDFLQIYNATWSQSRVEYVVTSPASNAGLLTSEVGNVRMDWTVANRNLIQEYHRDIPQVSMCPKILGNAWNRTTSTGGAPMTEKINGRVSTPQRSSLPQRYPPERLLSRSGIIDSAARLPTSARPLRRTSSRQMNIMRRRLEGGNINPQIEDPETEFMSVYPKEIVRYERPSICSRRKTEFE